MNVCVCVYVYTNTKSLVCESQTLLKGNVCVCVWVRYLADESTVIPYLVKKRERGTLVRNENIYSGGLATIGTVLMDQRLSYVVCVCFCIVRHSKMATDDENRPIQECAVRD